MKISKVIEQVQRIRSEFGEVDVALAFPVDDFFAFDFDFDIEPVEVPKGCSEERFNDAVCAFTHSALADKPKKTSNLRIL